MTLQDVSTELQNYRVSLQNGLDCGKSTILLRGKFPKDDTPDGVYTMFQFFTE